MAVLALKAGKHVYVEKPSSHNPREGELLIAAQKKYGKLVQVGDQQRSSDHSIRIINDIHSGRIGKAYYAKAWYVNTRKSMGIGKVVPVPDYLDWDLWQGPVPRGPYKDNIHPYNWHWLTRYGTGEALNNGTHEVDVARWALGLEYPERINASGGRYAFHDDWQFPDTMVTNFEYPDHMISWESRSCNGMKIYGRDRGITVHGTEGTVLLDRSGYEVYDLNGKKTDEFIANKNRVSSSDLVGRDSMTDAHFANFIAGIQQGEPLHSPITVANVSVTMLQISNIAWRLKRELALDKYWPHQGCRGNEAVGTRVSAGLGDEGVTREFGQNPRSRFFSPRSASNRSTALWSRSVNCVVALLGNSFGDLCSGHRAAGEGRCRTRRSEFSDCDPNHRRRRVRVGDRDCARRTSRHCSGGQAKLDAADALRAGHRLVLDLLLPRAVARSSVEGCADRQAKRCAGYSARVAAAG
jgi:predicted dehydrogenase